MLALAIGVVWLLEVTVIRISGETVLSILLMLLGLGMVATGRRGGRLWPVLVGLLLTIALVSGSTSFHGDIPTNGGFGNRLSTVASWSDLQPTYELTAGTQTVDLTNLPAASIGSTRTVVIRQGFGKVTIVVPPSLPVAVHARLTFGTFVSPNGPTRGGVDVRQDYYTPSGNGTGPTLQINVRVFAGTVAITPLLSPPDGPPSPKGGGS